MRRAPILALLVALAVVTASCSDEPLPLDAWEARWGEMVEQVHAAGEGGITQDECEETLALLRTERPELYPTPLEDLDPPVETWFTEAEAAFFECRFDGSGDLGQLRVIEAEVDAVLSLEG